jgi:hypothetical protein
MITSIIMKHGFLLGCLLLTLLLLFTVAVISHEQIVSDKQPKRVNFSHQFHVSEAGIACADCHTDAAKSTKASDNLLAKMEACKSCHEEPMKSNCTYCHLSADSTAYTATPNPVRELMFSHQQHVEDQKVPCETCHTVLDKASAATGELLPAMATCTTCHNDTKATSACENCHTNFASLRPVEHNRTDFIHEHKRLARLGDAKCGVCHSQETCIDCHNGTELIKVDVPGRDLTSQRSPRLTAIDRGQGMRLTKVHDLNFRFTHGIAAKGKSMECQTCHSAEKYCSTCHEAGGNVNQGVFKPASHAVAGFTTLGVGSGGGELRGLRNEMSNHAQHVTVRKGLIRCASHVIRMPMEEKELIRKHMILVLCQTTMDIGITIRAPIATCATPIRMHGRAVLKDKNSAAIATDNGVD